MVYYADCAGGLPDLRNFRRKQHKILVLDELHPENAAVLKKIMQSSNDDAVMASSPTMQHAYRVNSYQTMIVVTTNTWSSGLCTMPGGDVDWLKANSVYVHVTTPCGSSGREICSLCQCTLDLPGLSAAAFQLRLFFYVQCISCRHVFFGEWLLCTYFSVAWGR